jgi:hypothetical protein
MVALINDDDRPSELVAIPRYSRRLTDKILIAFHGACDQGEFDIAARLLQVLEMIFERSHAPGDRRRNTESLVAAHERLWELRHPVDEDC